MMRLKCTIKIAPISYAIEFRKGLLKVPLNLQKYLQKTNKKVALICDDSVADLHGQSLFNVLKKSGLEVFLFVFPHGEKHKTRKTKEYLEDQMLAQKLGRDTIIIALGGGVTCDIAGFVAATYCRGLPWISIPTTLLGMVDAAIGGKTGINLGNLKNRIGAFHQPQKVFIDIDVLQTLPSNELKNGLVEMIKIAAIGDEAYFAYLEKNCHKLLLLDPAALERAIWESCRLKKSIVEIDEKENGKRVILNFGHTVGHALEEVLDYKISHGEAVATGMLFETFLSWKLGYLTLKKPLQRLQALLQKIEIPLNILNMPLEAVLERVFFDKKMANGKINCPLLKDIGKVECYPVTVSQLKKLSYYAVRCN